MCTDNIPMIMLIAMNIDLGVRSTFYGSYKQKMVHCIDSSIKTEDIIELESTRNGSILLAKKVNNSHIIEGKLYCKVLIVR